MRLLTHPRGELGFECGQSAAPGPSRSSEVEPGVCSRTRPPRGAARARYEHPQEARAPRTGAVGLGVARATLVRPGDGLAARPRRTVPARVPHRGDGAGPPAQRDQTLLRPVHPREDPAAVAGAPGRRHRAGHERLGEWAVVPAGQGSRGSRLRIPRPLPAARPLPSGDQPSAHASWPCSTCPAARAARSSAAPPRRPSGPSPARGTSS